eukprot:752089_1
MSNSQSDKPRQPTREEIILAIVNAPNAGDGCTKGTVYSWLEQSVGYTKTALFKTKVDKLLTQGKTAGILKRGKNASRYKLTDPTSSEIQNISKLKIEKIKKIKAKAVGGKKKTGKKKSPKKKSTYT